MEEFGLKYHHINTIEAEQGRLKGDIVKNQQSYNDIKGAMDSIMKVAVERREDVIPPVEVVESDISSSTANTTIDVADLKDVEETAMRKELMSKFLSSVAEGQVNEDTLKEIQSLNDKLEQNKKITDELLVNFNTLNCALKDLKNGLNNIKQYLKIENLLFHNFFLPPGYKNMSSLQFSHFMSQQINYLLPQLDYPLSWEHISTAHPLRTKRKNSNVIVVRFCNRFMRDEIFAKRHFISKKGCAITEHLTEDNLNVLKKAKSIFGFNNVSTTNCNVFVNVNGVQRFVKSTEHVNELFESIHVTDQTVSDINKAIHSSSTRALRSGPSYAQRGKGYRCDTTCVNISQPIRK